MHRIFDLDQKLTSLFADFGAIAKELDIPFICNLVDEKTIAMQKYPGIYRIDVSTAGQTHEVADWISAFRSEWEHDDYKKKFTPNLKIKRIAHHLRLPLPEWMPLYLGKSKNVGARVGGHISLGLDKTTFALKLKARPSMAARVFRLHALEMHVKNYDLVVPALESALRERFNPLVGKQ